MAASEDKIERNEQAETPFEISNPLFRNIETLFALWPFRGAAAQAYRRGLAFSAGAFTRSRMSQHFLTFDTPGVGGRSGRYYYTVAKQLADGSLASTWAWCTGPTKRDKLLDKHNPFLQPGPDFFECLQKKDPEFPCSL